MLRGTFITISYSTYEKKGRNNLVQDRYSKESHDAVDIYSLDENKVLWKIFANKVPWALNVSCPLDRGRQKKPQNIFVFWKLGTKTKKSGIRGYYKYKPLTVYFLRKTSQITETWNYFMFAYEVINLHS